VVDQALTAFGAIDILVNNAGITWGAEPEAMPLDRWRKVLDTNLTGAFMCAQIVGRHMLDRGSGSIINIASIAGLEASVDGPHYAGYAASKAGLLGLTRELAASWGRRGVRVNAIAPGFFPTRLTEGIIDAAEARMKADGPIPRAGRPGELKGTAVFLASDASSYVTGQVIVVDGGLTIA
jgi:gluconate 5-dehydrogenase